MKEYPLVGIMVSNEKRRKRCLKQYLQYNHLNLILFTFTPGNIDWANKIINGLYYVNDEWREEVFPFPQVVYNRCYRNKKKTIDLLEHYIGKSKCFNSQNQLNKWKVYETFSHSVIKEYLPDTFRYETIDVISYLDKYKVLFLKPCRGHMGKGTYRIEQTEDGHLNIYQDYPFPPKYTFSEKHLFLKKLKQLICRKKYIVQAEISTAKFQGRFFDIRAMVQKNIDGKWTVSALCSRVAYEYLYNTSFYEYVLGEDDVKTQILVTQKYPEINYNDIIDRISLEAAELLNKNIGLLGEFCIDFVLDNHGKLWIIEVNGKPQKVIYNELSDTKAREIVYKRPLEYAYFLAGN